MKKLLTKTFLIVSLFHYFTVIFISSSVFAQSNTIIVNPNITYQTITGWEAEDQAGQAMQTGKVTGKSNVNPAFAMYSPALFDRLVNELGITRLRVEVGSGAENTVDYYQQFLNGQIPFAAC